MAEPKICVLCRRTIEKYDSFLHHFDLDDGLSAEICSHCSDRILKHQQEIFAKLFPTKAAKRHFGKKD